MTYWTNSFKMILHIANAVRLLLTSNQIGIFLLIYTHSHPFIFDKASITHRFLLIYLNVAKFLWLFVYDKMKIQSNLDFDWIVLVKFKWWMRWTAIPKRNKEKKGEGREIERANKLRFHYYAGIPLSWLSSPLYFSSTFEFMNEFCIMRRKIFTTNGCKQHLIHPVLLCTTSLFFTRGMCTALCTYLA